MKPLIKLDGSIEPHEFFTFNDGKNKGKKLRIVGTKSTGLKAMESVEKIKNLDTGVYNYLERIQLNKLNPIII